MIHPSRVLMVCALLITTLGQATAQLATVFAPMESGRNKTVFSDENRDENSGPTIGNESLNAAEEWKNWSTVQNFAFEKNRGEMSMINDLKALHPFFRDRIFALIAECKKKGITLAVVETYRTHAKQNEYKTMGKKYTSSKGGKSKHQYGLAVDVVPVVNSKPVWDNVVLWKKIGTVGEKLGLRWGGRWKHPYDPGHFEWTGGLTSVHLAQGTLPVVPNAKIKYPCLEEDIETLREYWRAWEEAQRRN